VGDEEGRERGKGQGKLELRERVSKGVLGGLVGATRSMVEGRRSIESKSGSAL
jgi:hypothetical protein